jgi:hypothetical protein
MKLRDAFHALAEMSSIKRCPEIQVGLALIKLSFEEFNSWLKTRGYSKQKFWLSPLKKPRRGRPAEYNWNGVRAKLTAYVSEHGPIQTFDELLQKCGDFASDLHAKKQRPDDKTIREAIRTHSLDVAASYSPGK